MSQQQLYITTNSAKPLSQNPQIRSQTWIGEKRKTDGIKSNFTTLAQDRRRTRVNKPIHEKVCMVLKTRVYRTS